MKPTNQQKHWVMLARPVIQTTIVEVTAKSEAEAEEKARELAADLDDSAWDGEFQEEKYGLDVVFCLAKEYIERGEDPLEITGRLGSTYNYMLLKADMEFGDGTLIVQPWLHRCNPVSVADFLGDWKDATVELYDDSVTHMYEWIEKRVEDKHKATHSESAKIIYLGPYLAKRSRILTGDDI